MTHGSYLARHSKEADSFPIARGLHVLRQVLCQEIPEPNIELPPAPEQKLGVTTRKLYEDFTAAAACQACHGRINGVGFAFENYDAVGRLPGEGRGPGGRLERQRWSCASGKLTFKNGIELVKALATTPEAARLRWPATGCASCCAGKNGPRRADRSRPSRRRSPRRPTTCASWW